MSKHFKFDSSIFLLKSSVPLSRSLRSFVVRGSEGVFEDVLWLEPAGSWLESSLLLASDKVNSGRLVVAGVLMLSFRVVSMTVVSMLVAFKLCVSMHSRLGSV